MNLNEWEQNYYNLFIECFEKLHSRGGKAIDKARKWKELMVFCKYMSMCQASGKPWCEEFLQGLIDLERELDKCKI